MLLILQASSYEGRPASEVSISMSIVTWWLSPSLTLSSLLSGSSPSFDVESFVTTSLYDGGEDHFSSSSKYSCLELLTLSLFEIGNSPNLSAWLMKGIALNPNAAPLAWTSWFQCRPVSGGVTETDTSSSRSWSSLSSWAACLLAATAVMVRYSSTAAPRVRGPWGLQRNIITLMTLYISDE